MNDWQTLKQTAWLLAQQAWPTGDQRLVFAAVVVTTPEEVKNLPMTAGFPMALPMMGDSKPDDSEPNLAMTAIDVLVLAQMETRELELSALVGGLRTGGVGRSEGRGLLEVWEEALNAVGRLTGAGGVPATAAYAGAPAAARAEGSEAAVARRMTVNVLTTKERTYDAPRFLLLTALGAGALKADWYLPPARWDRRRVIVRYAAGATAPAGPTAGIDVPVAVGAVTATWTPAAPGTWSVAIFEAYDETASGTDERFSPQTPDSYGTKVVT